jgi:hypothetical protein
MSEQLEKKTLNQSMLFAEDSPVKTCPLPESGRVLLESGQDYGLSLLELLTSLNRAGLSSKTSPVYYPAIKGRILPSSFDGWSNAGMAFAGGYLTLNISEWPNAAAVCSLSQVLEADAPQKYYLSPKACSGILRRAAKRGKELPERLRFALEAMGGGKGYLGLDDGAMTLGGQPQWVTDTLDAKSCSANRGGQSNEDEFLTTYSQDGFSGYKKDFIAGTERSHQEKDATDLICWEMQHASEAYRESGDIAPNLQARMGTGGNNVPCVGVRRLTPTECARLQGFPDDWNSFQSDSSRYKQYGNAVTVNVAEWIGKRIMESVHE